MASLGWWMNDGGDWSEEFTSFPTLFNASESKILVGVSAVETVQYWLQEQYLAQNTYFISS